MTEQALQQALNETTNFLQRQGLLKQLWKLRRLREANIESHQLNLGRQLSHSTPRVASRRAERVAT